MENQPKRKTYSREFSLILFIHLVYLSVESPNLFDIVVWPYVTFWLYAFGAKEAVVKDFVDKKK